MSKGRYFCGGSALAVTLVLSFSASQAMAQKAAPPASAENAPEVAEVITTGTYIRGAAEDAAIPVEVTTRADLQNQGEPSLTALVRGMSEIGNTLQGDSSRSGGNPAETTMNLRNLGSNRTLVLLNGIRISAEATGGTTNGDSQNIAQIPTEVLSQVEQLKDGGAATYGSAAVAGVVNFRTRTDLNGVEAGASYTYVPGGDGNYTGNIQWGKRSDNNNVLLNFSFSQTGELRANERDFSRQPFLLGATTTGVGAGYSSQANPGVYAFTNAANAVYIPNLADPAGLPTPGVSTIDPVTGRTLLATSVTAATGLVTAAGSTGGLVRDPLCTAEGGYRTFSQVVAGVTNPACITNFNQAEDLISQTNRYGVFADTNFDVNDKWRVNSSFNFSKTVIPFNVFSGVTGGGTNAPCDPYDISVTNGTGLAQNCVGQGGTATTAATQYFASGYNPAVLDFMSKARTNSYLTDQFGNPLASTSGQTSAGQPYFSAAQIAATASCLPGTGTSQATACAAAGVDAVGRTVLRTGLWSPFGLGGIGQNDPMFKNGENTQRVENTYFTTSNTLKGDLGEVFGTQLDLRLSGQYTHQFYDVKGKGILVDRLQRALNGFATNLDDRSGTGNTIDRCTAAETLGARAGATTNTPYSVGAGGGWGDVDGATNGAVTGAGNGCYFFNPFASAVTNIMYGGGKAVAGSATTYGFINSGFYQGYGFDPNQMTLTNGVYTPKAGYTGSGLVNQNGIINWLFENRQSRLTQDTINLQAVLNGSGGFNLKGGPLAWALGSEYRYYRRDQQYDILSNRTVNPCTFITNVAGTALNGRANQADQDDVNVVGKNNLGTAGYENYTANCTQPSNATTGIAAANASTQTGVWFDSFGINNSTPFTKEDRSIAGFGELDLPFLDKLKGTASVRYERDRFNALVPAAAVVTAFNLSYQATSGLTFRASTGQTFQNVDCSTTAVPNCVVGLNTATPQGVGSSLISTANNSQLTSAGVLAISQASRQDTYGNNALNPERGSNFSFGVVYHPTQAFLASVDLVNIKIVGTRQAVSANQIAHLLTGETAVGASLTDADVTAKSICSAPSALFAPGALTSPTQGQPLVTLVSASGATRLACQAGDPLTTVAGTTIGGTQYGLLYSVPNVVNAGISQTRQLDEHLEYGLPNTVFGGKVQLTLDGTYLMFLDQDFGSYNIGGTAVSLGGKAKYKGLYSSDTANQTPSPFRGTIGLLWRSGKNTVNVQTHWAGAVADVTLGTPFAATAGAVGTNYNPIPTKAGGCSLTVANLLAPDPRMTSKVSSLVGSPGQGEESINTNCNVGNYTGAVVPGFVTTDLTYIRQMPGRTSLTVNITNLLDKDPPYQKQQPYYFAPYGTGNASGRTVKVSIHKVF